MSVAPSSAPKAHPHTHKATPSHARKPKTKARRHAVPSHARHPSTTSHPTTTTTTSHTPTSTTSHPTSTPTSTSHPSSIGSAITARHQRQNVAAPHSLTPQPEHGQTTAEFFGKQAGAVDSAASKQNTNTIPTNTHGPIGQAGGRKSGHNRTIAAQNQALGGRLAPRSVNTIGGRIPTAPTNVSQLDQHGNPIRISRPPGDTGNTIKSVGKQAGKVSGGGIAPGDAMAMSIPLHTGPKPAARTSSIPGATPQELAAEREATRNSNIGFANIRLRSPNISPEEAAHWRQRLVELGAPSTTENQNLTGSDVWNKIKNTVTGKQPSAPVVGNIHSLTGGPVPHLLPQDKEQRMHNIRLYFQGYYSRNPSRLNEPYHQVGPKAAASGISQKDFEMIQQQARDDVGKPSFGPGMTGRREPPNPNNLNITSIERDRLARQYRDARITPPKRAYVRQMPAPTTNPYAGTMDDRRHEQPTNATSTGPTPLPRNVQPGAGVGTVPATNAPPGHQGPQPVHDQSDSPIDKFFGWLGSSVGSIGKGLGFGSTPAPTEEVPVLAGYSRAYATNDALSNIGQMIDNLFAKMENKFGNVPGVTARLQQAEANVQNQLSFAQGRIAKTKAFRGRIN